jgi:hypothetical protein
MWMFDICEGKNLTLNRHTLGLLPRKIDPLTEQASWLKTYGKQGEFLEYPND